MANRKSCMVCACVRACVWKEARRRVLTEWEGRLGRPPSETQKDLLWSQRASSSLKEEGCNRELSLSGHTITHQERAWKNQNWKRASPTHSVFLGLRLWSFFQNGVSLGCRLSLSILSLLFITGGAGGLFIPKLEEGKKLEAVVVLEPLWQTILRGSNWAAKCD